MISSHVCSSLLMHSSSNTLLHACAGPIGLATSMWAFFRGAKRVILIDHDANRLALARKHMPNIEIIDYGKEDVVNTMHKVSRLRALSISCDTAIMALHAKCLLTRRSPCPDICHHCRSALVAPTCPSMRLDSGSQLASFTSWRGRSGTC